MTDMCDKIQQLGKGISSPSRYKILELLMSGPKTVTELVDSIGLTQPAVSQHLATLKSCELVESIKKGQEVYYSLHAKHMLHILRSLTSDVEKCKKVTS
ncbi:metalloregulator ArsR/SmtB family transcription factor [Candidatus Parcubacteria bacterium]|nr:metalloregulator ArsR/SmtB family transcription factor [Candidatus Parcubacteria bacterium]